MGLTNYADANMLANANSSHISIFHMFTDADLLVKVIMLCLIITSMVSWTIIFNKITLFITQKKSIKNFEQQFLEANDIIEFHSQLNKNTHNPMSMVFKSAVKQIKSSFYAENADSELMQRDMHNTMQNTAIEATKAMENNLPTLATIASVSPFVGLFGTVWGIMTSFQAIAGAKNTSLAVVAPGIAEALLVTAIGLFTAIPALIFYNKFVGEINKISNKLEVFMETISIQTIKNQHTISPTRQTNSITGAKKR